MRDFQHCYLTANVNKRLAKDVKSMNFKITTVITVPPVAVINFSICLSVALD